MIRSLLSMLRVGVMCCSRRYKTEARLAMKLAAAAAILCLYRHAWTSPDHSSSSAARWLHQLSYRITINVEDLVRHVALKLAPFLPDGWGWSEPVTSQLHQSKIAHYQQLRDWLQRVPIREIPDPDHGEFPRGENSTFASDFPDSHRSEEEDEVTVLMWYVAFQDKSVPLEYVHEVVDHYDVTDDVTITSPLCGGRCKLTFDRGQHGASDAVVLHALDLSDRTTPSPHIRRENQVYVWWLQESITTAKENFPQVFEVATPFNLTMSMRRSSDIHSPYASLQWVLKLLSKRESGMDVMENVAKIKVGTLTSARGVAMAVTQLPASPETVLIDDVTSFHPRLRTLLQKKSKTAIWIVSNCKSTKTTDIRFDFISDLKLAGMKLHQFGACNRVPFPIESRWDPAFFEVISRYKFYLVAENSVHCTDYITEKLWYNSLYSGVVPILFGADQDDIRSSLPPHSYIHAENFPTPVHLVHYLEYLNRNHTAYAEYLRWRTWVRYLDSNGDFRPDRLGPDARRALDRLPGRERMLLAKYLTPKPTGFCALCRLLHDRKRKPRVVDIKRWQSSTEREECFNPVIARQKLGLPFNKHRREN